MTSRERMFESRRESRRMHALEEYGLVFEGRHEQTNLVKVMDHTGTRDVPVKRTEHFTRDGIVFTAYVPPRQIIRELTGRRV